MENRKKIVYLVSRFPYPLIKGDKLRAYHQIKELSSTCDVYLMALSDEVVSEDSLKALQPYCADIKVFKLNYLTLIVNVIISFFLSKRPIQTAYFYNKNIQKEINRAIREIKPDHVFCQLIRTALYINELKNIPKTLDYMDALSAGMERRAENSPKILRPLFKLEANRLKRFEHGIYKDFDHSIIISESDRDLIFHYENEEINVIPNGIDMDYFTAKEHDKDYDLVFTGNMSYPPNVQSALYLIEEIMPEVWKIRPETNLLISGANPVQKLKQLKSDKVTILGWIDDIRASYSRSSIFVAPMLIGSGLQNKLLEAMAMKLPCISSELANKSLEASEGESILIGRSKTEYVNHIIDLLEKPQKAMDLAEKGHSFVSGKFSWSKSNKLLLQILENGRT